MLYIAPKIATCVPIAQWSPAKTSRFFTPKAYLNAETHSLLQFLPDMVTLSKRSLVINENVTFIESCWGIKKVLFRLRQDVGRSPRRHLPCPGRAPLRETNYTLLAPFRSIFW